MTACNYGGSIGDGDGIGEGNGEGNGDGNGDDDEQAPTGVVFIFAHGFGAGADQSFVPEIFEALEAGGFQVFKTDVPPVATVAERAVVMAEQVETIIENAADVHIIAHSMGGLDARYLISTLAFGDRIDSLTTISTPHRGTPLADSAEGIDVFGGLLGGGGADQASFDEAVADLSEANATLFNAANFDVDGVFYQSFAGLSRFAGLPNQADAIDCAADNAVTPEPDTLRAALVPTAGIVAGEERRAHDGVVPVNSARWGTFRGCISADDVDELGQAGAVQPSFDAIEFYTTLVAELATP